MKIAVHTDPQTPEKSFASRWIASLEDHGIQVLRMNLLEQGSMDQIRTAHGVMWHWFHSPDDKQTALKILPAIEYGLGIPVFPDLHTCWHYDEKVAQHYLLESIQAPRVKSWVFWKLSDAFDFLSSCTYPVVFKLSVGAGSANVMRIDTRKEAMTFARRMFHEGIFPYTMNEYEKKYTLKTRKDFLDLVRRVFYGLRYTFIGKYPPLSGYFIPQKNYIYLQEFIPGNPHDIRITVIGNRAFGFIRYNREGDFRASGSGHIDHDPNKIPLDALKIAHDISLKNTFQSMAYDFLVGQNGKMLLNEISYCYLSSAVYECPGYWDRDLKWHEGHVWPEDAHVEDFIASISGKASE
ncbi:MAG TPA: hypothetical protein ENN34_03740 [Deltaproteobacteria bacterium]|nr:hypothetical protein [Deltaproteobacteria bacterium]